MKILRHVDDLGGLIGLGLIVYSGYLVAPAAGIFLSGLSIWFVTWIGVRTLKHKTTERGGE